MKEEQKKKEYKTPVLEEKSMVSNKLVNSMQDALNKATETINKLKEETISMNDKYLRALADYQNLQRNSTIKISASKDAGKIDVFKSLLPVMDNFEKAIEAGEVTEGIQLIYNGLKNVFTSNGVEIIDPVQGDKFNDSLHEAVVPVYNPGFAKNTIAFTQLKGYKLGDNIIRYAKVGVYIENK